LQQAISDESYDGAVVFVDRAKTAVGGLILDLSARFPARRRTEAICAGAALPTANSKLECRKVGDLNRHLTTDDRIVAADAVDARLAAARAKAAK